jgi:hypothetical protein
MRYTRLFECDDSFEESVEIGPDLQSALGQQTLGKWCRTNVGVFLLFILSIHFLELNQ